MNTVFSQWGNQELETIGLTEEEIFNRILRSNFFTHVGGCMWQVQLYHLKDIRAGTWIGKPERDMGQTQVNGQG